MGRRKRPRARKMAAATRPAPAALNAPPYQAAATRNSDIALWCPPLISSDAALGRDLDLLTSRADDTVRNDPFALNAVRISRDSVVGAVAKLSLKPNARVMGIRQEAAQEWAREIEREWELYAETPWYHSDARRMQTFSQQLWTAHNTFFSKGAALGVIKFKRGFSDFRTCLHVINPDRLSNPNGRPDSRSLRFGVEMDQDGAPLFFNIRNGHPSDMFADARGTAWERVRYNTAWGRPIVLHVFDHMHAEMTRGVTQFASVSPADEGC